MSQQKRPDQGDATHSRAHVRNAVALITQGPAAYTDLDNIQNIQNPLPRAVFTTRDRDDNPGKDWEIVRFPRRADVKFWVTINGANGHGEQITERQQTQQKNWQIQVGEKYTGDQWPILKDNIQKSDEAPTAWQDPNFMAWFEETKNKIITDILASKSNSSTTSHSGGSTYTMESQYPGSVQYQRGEDSNNSSSTYTAGSQYPGSVQYQREKDSNNNSDTYTMGSQYPGSVQYQRGEDSNNSGGTYTAGSQYSGGDQYQGGEGSNSGGGTYTAGSQYLGGVQYQGGEGSNSGGGTYTAGSQYSGGDQYQGGGGSNSGGGTYTAGSQYSGGDQYQGGGGSNSGGGTYTAGSQYLGGDHYQGGEGSNSGGAQYPSSGGAQYPSSGTSGRGAGYSGRHHHRKDPY
ncbi:hypothetical protein EAF00_002964 [Botryotinia globosa]|nr:hypothetical protein EAF00_002964 [Botryotinia globosa]